MPNTRNTGEVPLHKSSRAAHINRMLDNLLHGANTFDIDHSGWSPLHITANTTAFELLLLAGADPNIVNPITGTTPLHEAAKFNNDVIVSILLRYGADPTIRAKDGKLPSEMALEKARTALTAHARRMQEIRDLAATQNALQTSIPSTSEHAANQVEPEASENHLSQQQPHTHAESSGGVLDLTEANLKPVPPVKRKQDGDLEDDVAAAAKKPRSDGKAARRKPPTKRAIEIGEIEHVDTGSTLNLKQQDAPSDGYPRDLSAQDTAVEISHVRQHAMGKISPNILHLDIPSKPPVAHVVAPPETLPTSLHIPLQTPVDIIAMQVQREFSRFV